MSRVFSATTTLLLIALFIGGCIFFSGPERPVETTRQSPLPTATPAGPTPLPTPEFCIHYEHDCVLLEFLGYAHNGDGTTTLNYRITNHCADKIEYFAIETGFWTRFEPADGATYTGNLGEHAVTWVDDQQGIPTQGLRFDNTMDAFKEGAAEVYTFTVRDFTPRSPNTARVVVGERELAFNMILLDPACEIGVNPTPRPTPTAPFSPLPTPIPSPEPLADVEVYVLGESIFALDLSLSEKEKRWSQGLPVPLLNANFTDEQEVTESILRNQSHHNYKPGLLARAASDTFQTVESWQERDFENFEADFPNTSNACVWSRTQRAGGGQSYIWGKASDRSVSPSSSIWPAGAVNADAPSGTQPLPANSSYPANMIISVICKLSGMAGAKNVLTEFQMWYELADAGDALSLQFFSGADTSDEMSLTYRGGLEWRGVDAGLVAQDWVQYRIYYPELATTDSTIWVKWKFTSDGNDNAARGPWLDDLSVWSYRQPTSSTNCESIDPTFAPDLSKGLNVPPHAEDIKNGEPEKIMAMANRLTESDVDWIRLEFKFHPSSLTNTQGEPIDASQADGYNHIDYRHYDRIIDTLCGADPPIAVLGLVTNQTLLRQDWKVEDGDGIIVANFYQEDFIDVTSQLVDYYDDRIGVWEIWNEPDNRERRLAPIEFATLLANTYQAIKTQAPNDLVLFGGLGGVDPNAGGYSLRVFNVLVSISPRSFDIFALHPYHSIFYLNNEGHVENDPAYYLRGEIRYRPATIIRRFREQLDSDLNFPPQEQGKPIWATELGWNSAKDSMTCSNYLDLVVTELEQACYLQRGFHSLFNLSPVVHKIFWYQYHDTGQPIDETDCGTTGATLASLPSPSWTDSDVARYLLQAGNVTTVDIPWSFGLYNGDIWWDDLPNSAKAKLVQTSFKNWPATDVCMDNFPILATLDDLTKRVYLPLISRQLATVNGQ